VNLLERAALLSEANLIDAPQIVLPQRSMFPEAPASLVSYKQAKLRFETDYFTQLMRIAGGNISLAAKLGQKTRKEIYDALKRLGLDAMAYRSGSEPEMPAVKAHPR
jgi:two-component system response regulator GlrR